MLFQSRELERITFFVQHNTQRPEGRNAINRIELSLCDTLRFVANLQLLLSIIYDSLNRNGQNILRCMKAELSIYLK